VKKRKVLKWFGIGLLIVWLIVTIIAYNQHRLSDEVYVVGTYVEFENYGVLVKDVEIYDYEKDLNYRFNYEVFNWLPQKVAYRVSRIMSFYNSSTSSLEWGPEYVVNCEIITEDGNEFNIEEQDLRIVMYDTLPVDNYPRTGWGAGSEDNNNSIEYHYEAKWSDKDYQGISLKDYNTGEVIVIPFTEPSISKTYTFSNPKNSQLHRVASDRCSVFISRYYYSNKEEASEYLYQRQSDEIDWSLLDGVNYEIIYQYELSYESNNEVLGEVFNLLVKMEDNQTLTFKMIYTDEQWWILDFE